MMNNENNSPEEHRSQRVRQRQIGDKLKRLYDDVVSEPIPDEFLKLLENADKAAADPHSTDESET